MVAHCVASVAAAAVTSQAVVRFAIMRCTVARFRVKSGSCQRRPTLIILSVDWVVGTPRTLISIRGSIDYMLLKTADGIEFEIFLHGPDDAAAGVLLVHDWWGVLDYNHDWADRLVAMGYQVLLIDLYDGERARNAEEAGEMMRGLDQVVADSKLITAIDFLKRDQRPLATLGWSFGGRQAMQAALLDPETVVATVLFYCRMVTDVDQLSQLGGPVLAFYAESERTWPDKMERFSQAMSAAGQQVVTVTYSADHGFVNPRSERYNAAASAAAWEQTENFLRQQLAV